MKTIILGACLLALFNMSNAQLPDATKLVSSGQTDFIKPPAIGDVTKTTGGVVDMLSKSLSLPAAQKPKLTDAVGGFLNSKKGIAGLASSNPADYLKKFNPMQQGLFGKMKGIMGAAKFSQFLGLKPSGSGIAGNALSHLFF